MELVINTRRGAWDRRSAPRIEAALPAVYRQVTWQGLHLGPAGHNLPSPARAKNLSAVGVLLLVGERLDPHSVVSVALSLPESRQPVQSLAEVRHVQAIESTPPYAFALGLEFLSISQQDRELVHHYVGRRQR